MKRRLTLRVDGQELEVVVHRDGEKIVVERDGERHEVLVTSDRPEGVVEPPRAPNPSTKTAGAPGGRPASQPGGAEGGAGEVRAPMVGFVRAYNVKRGEKVAAGVAVVTMEAMKMDIQVTSPVAGVAGPPLVAVGETVSDGTVLMSVTPGA